MPLTLKQVYGSDKAQKADLPWKLENATLSYKMDKAAKKQIVKITFKHLQLHLHINDQTVMKETVTCYVWQPTISLCN